MKKMILYAGAIAVIGFAGMLPFRGTDVGRLHPVEVLVVSAFEEKIIVETDTQLRGTGETIIQAIENLKLTSAGEIFLDTANYVLVTAEAKPLLGELYTVLRPACQVYEFSGTGKWDNVAKYLESHSSNVTLLSYRQGKENVPKLAVSGEDYKIDRS